MASRKPQAAPSEILHLRITLRDIEPPVWRGIQVASDITFAKLHQTLQRVFGWEDYHLYEFEVGGTAITIPDDEFPDERTKKDPRWTKLSSLPAAAVSTFLYRYDFGDDWLHDIVSVDSFTPSPESGTRSSAANDQRLPKIAEVPTAMPF